MAIEEDKRNLRIKNWISFAADSPWRSIFVFMVEGYLTLTVCRFLLVCWQMPRVGGVNDSLRILISGIRMDTILLCYLLFLPALLAPLLNGFRPTHSVWKFFSCLWFSCCLFFLVLMEVATPFFISEYDTRPNRIFIEYLVYPKEVATMLLKGYKVELFLGGLVAMLILIFTRRHYPKLANFPSGWGVPARLFAFPLVGLLIFAGARSSLGHRPANPSTVAFAADQLVNSLTLSSAYSMLYAAYRTIDEADVEKMYGKMAVNKMLDVVQKTATGDTNAFTSDTIPTRHSFSPVVTRSSPQNLVIILEESLGAEFVGRMGGLPLTPNLDILCKEGLFFDRLYATGTRSVRGIEAVVTGFFPTPGRSVVKLGKSQSGFFSLASFLKREGYKTRFVYGGNANFDDMKRFFLGNGFDDVIEEKDFSNYTFKGSWGVCDEDLFAKTHEILDADGKEPSFTLVFTSSNHSPFEFPENTIELYETPAATVNNAVKYADYAIGRFFEMARNSSYWDHTLFLVVADHNSRVYGEALVPIERFHIPALIIGPGVKPGVNNNLASQADLPPTLLSLMGFQEKTPMLGRNLLDMPEGVVGRAMMQFYNNYAYWEGERVMVLQPGKKYRQFRYNGMRLAEEDLDASLVEKALAHSLWASWSYNNRNYRLQ